MKIFIGIFLCFSVFSSFGVVIEDMSVNNPYAPFPWPCDSLADCASSVIPDSSVIPAKAGISSNSEEDWIPASAGMTETDSMNSPYAPFPWPCDSLADCASSIIPDSSVIPAKAGISSNSEEDWIPASAGMTETDSMNSPYAPFPWPCDSLADCASSVIPDSSVIPAKAGISSNSEEDWIPASAGMTETDSMNSPYAPFPWPCDSLADCASSIIPDSSVIPAKAGISSNSEEDWIPASAGMTETDSMNSPYAPFPWPCDSLADCASSVIPAKAGISSNSEEDWIPASAGMTETDSMNSPYAPFPWPCDSLADCASTYSEQKLHPADSMNSPYAPFPWPCDSLADCASTYSEYRHHPMAAPVIEIENSFFYPRSMEL